MSASRVAAGFFRILGSFGLAAVLFLVLLILVFFGTLEQADHSIYEVQKRYFESILFIPDSVPIPLPGAYLVLMILSVNLMVGGFLRMRRTRSRVWIFVIHSGIVVLLMGSMVEFLASDKGQVALFEGESASEFRSYNEWEVAIAEQLGDGRERAHLILHDDFADLKPGRSRGFHSDELPFRVTLAGYVRNCRPRPVPAGGGIDGFVLSTLPYDLKEERNLAGITVTLTEPDGKEHRVLLWGRHRFPAEVHAGGKRWSIDLRKRSWPLPFELKLVKTERKLHPRTGTPSAFSSDVTRFENGIATDVHISMNAPMRHAGLTFYQSGFSAAGEAGSLRAFSSLAVVRNPADRVPIYAVSLIFLGLLGHLLRKLKLHIDRTSRSASA